MRVLRARGVESEAEIPFAGLLELLRPALARARPDPGARRPRRSRVRSRSRPATRAGPVRGRAPRRSACSPPTPRTARSSLLVDDAHWLDGSSAEALLFAARRLVADPIAVVLAVARGRAVAARRRRPARARRPRARARRRRRRCSRRPTPGDVAERLHRATGGNPLALLELAPDASSPRGRCRPDAPVPISAGIATAFAAPLRRRCRERDPARPRRSPRRATPATSRSLERAAASLGLDVDDLAAGGGARVSSTLDGGRGRLPPSARALGDLRRRAAAERRGAHRRSPPRCRTATSTGAPGTSQRRRRPGRRGAAALEQAGCAGPRAQRLRGRRGGVRARRRRSRRRTTPRPAALRGRRGGLARRRRGRARSRCSTSADATRWTTPLSARDRSPARPDRDRDAAR